MKKILASFLLLISFHAQALDIYIGTLEARNGQVILTRCDLAQNRYVLLGESQNQKAPIKQFLQKFEGENVFVYGEAIGQYEEKDGNNILVVKALKNIQRNKSCHLIDVLPKS